MEQNGALTKKQHIYARVFRHWKEKLDGNGQEGIKDHHSILEKRS